MVCIDKTIWVAVVLQTVLVAASGANQSSHAVSCMVHGQLELISQNPGGVSARWHACMVG